LFRQRGALAGQSRLCSHWTQVLFAQTGRSVGHWLFWVHSTQRPPGLQMAAGALQSAAPRQATQRPLPVSHRGAPPPHWALDVQPDRHIWFWRSQTGVVPPQFAELVHCTQRPSGLQIGAAAGQSLVARQVTQVFKVASQKGRLVPAQVASVRQPTQAPEATSQVRAPPF
jgi:hypothetical protein